MIKYIIIGVMMLASPCIFLMHKYTMERTVDELVAAAKADDAEAVAARVDWDGLRAQLKELIRAQKAAMGQHAAMAGPDDAQIDAVVDYYVMPENIPILFYHHDLIFPGVAEEDFIHSVSYYPPFGWQMTVGYPKNAEGQGGELATLAQDRLKVRLIFRLDGLTWKLSEMQVPIYMVPRGTTPNMPAIDLYGPPKTMPR